MAKNGDSLQSGQPLPCWGRRRKWIYSTLCIRGQGKEVLKRLTKIKNWLRNCTTGSRKAGFTGNFGPAQGWRGGSGSKSGFQTVESLHRHAGSYRRLVLYGIYPTPGATGLQTSPL
jgi:hypothetical protein